jgi:hypothetical protein
MAEQRLVLAPWLVLTGRSWLALARVLRDVQGQQQPSDISSLMGCVLALATTTYRHPGLLQCWNGGFSGINSSGIYTGTADGRHPCLKALQQQLMADDNFAAGLGHAAVAVASAAAAATAGYLPAYGALKDDDKPSPKPLFEGLLRLLLDVNDHMCDIEAAGGSWQPNGSGSSSSPSSSSSSSSDDEVHTTKDETDHALDLINSCTTQKECWQCFISCSLLQSACEGFEQLGLWLCNQLPMPWLCINPHCSNLSGVSELQLVGGKACVCKGCRVAR